MVVYNYFPLALSAATLISNAFGYAITTPASAPIARATNASPACGIASSASASYMAANPSAAAATIPAQLAYSCLETVPNIREPAIDLINGLKPYFEIQSSLAYLRNPPSGFLEAPVDIQAGLDEILEKVINGAYHSEFDFQTDIRALVFSAHDGHFSWTGDLIALFTWKRTFDLVSLSTDGLQLPQVYVAADVANFVDDQNPVSLVTGYAPSPVKEIDGLPVISFLLRQSLAFNLQDPDAKYNADFFQLGRQSFLSQTKNVRFYPGPSTKVTFVNGTIKTYDNVALVNEPLDGIQSGDELYTSLLIPATTSSAATSTVSTSTTSSTAPTNQPVFASGYPYPAIKDSQNLFLGYFLNDTDYNDVAVLQVASYEPTVLPDNWQQEVQNVLQNFFAAAVKLGKRKLILDFQGNPGGIIDVGLELCAQLFPSIAPNTKSNLRETLGTEIMVASIEALIANATNATEAEYLILQGRPLDFQGSITPDLKAFPSSDAYIEPVVLAGDNFTQFFQYDYRDINATKDGDSTLVITGTNNRTGFRQPFAAENIIMLVDGFCSSTCTTVAEYLKNEAGVQTITIGGRPQTGPMQGIGGVKGSQVFPTDILETFLEIFEAAPPPVLELAAGTVWENFTEYPTLRSTAISVNGLNHFRIGDTTETPLQFVYEAADCRLLWTREMLTDPVFLWNRVAQVAFKDRKNTQFNSEYCVKGSTGQPTSISGGWKQGTLGPQTPPQNAKQTVDGWGVNSPALSALSPSSGKTVTSGKGAVDDNISKKPAKVSDGVKQACDSYNGESWLFKVACNVL